MPGDADVDIAVFVVVTPDATDLFLLLEELRFVFSSASVSFAVLVTDDVRRADDAFVVVLVIVSSFFAFALQSGQYHF